MRAAGVALAAVGKNYYAAVTGKKDHDQGAPFLHFWVGMIKCLAEAEAVDSDTKQHFL